MTKPEAEELGEKMRVEFGKEVERLRDLKSRKRFHAETAGFNTRIGKGIETATHDPRMSTMFAYLAFLGLELQVVDSEK